MPPRVRCGSLGLQASKQLTPAKTRATEETQQQLEEAESTTVESLAAKSDELSSATDKLIATVGSDA